MTRVLGLRLDLQRVVMSAALVGDVGNRGEREIRKLGRLWEESAAGAAAQGISSSRIWAARAGVRSRDVEVVAVNEDVTRSGAGVTDGKYDVTGNLALHIHVELLDLAGPEIDVLRLDSPREAGGVRLRSEDRETIGKTQGRRSHTVDSRTSSSREGATGHGEGKGIGLRVEGRILPQALGALAPGGVVVDGVAGADDGFVAALNFISQADAGFEIFPIGANTCTVADIVYARNQELAVRGVEVSLAAGYFRDGGGDVPCQSDIYGEILGCAPVVLNIGTENLPTAPGGIAKKGLVVDVQTGESQGQVVDGVKVGPGAGQNPVPVLEAVGADVHLHGADGAAHFDVMFAKNHLKGIVNGIDVGTPGKGGETAVSQGDVTTTQLGRTKAAADDVAFTSAAICTAKIGTRDAKLGCFAASSPKRSDVVENAVVAAGNLVDLGGREDVSFGKRNIAAMILNTLIATERILFREARPAARNVGDRLVITETGESCVGC